MYAKDRIYDEAGELDFKLKPMIEKPQISERSYQMIYRIIVF